MRKQRHISFDVQPAKQKADNQAGNSLREKIYRLYRRIDLNRNLNPFTIFIR